MGQRGREGPPGPRGETGPPGIGEKGERGKKFHYVLLLFIIQLLFYEGSKTIAPPHPQFQIYFFNSEN